MRLGSICSRKPNACFVKRGRIALGLIRKGAWIAPVLHFVLGKMLLRLVLGTGGLGLNLTRFMNA